MAAPLPSARAREPARTRRSAGRTRISQGFLVVRLNRSKGELSTPESGHERVVPLAPPFLADLQDVKKKARLVQGVKEKTWLVSSARREKPWDERSLNHAPSRP